MGFFGIFLVAWSVIFDFFTLPLYWILQNPRHVKADRTRKRAVIRYAQCSLYISYRNLIPYSFLDLLVVDVLYKKTGEVVQICQGPEKNAYRLVFFSQKL